MIPLTVPYLYTLFNWLLANTVFTVWGENDVARLQPVLKYKPPTIISNVIYSPEV